MRHLRLLLSKEFILLKNTYFRTKKQTASTVGLSMLAILLTAVLAVAAFIWFRPLVEDIPPQVVGNIFQPLVLVVYTWVTLIYFFSTMQESKNKFFLTPDLALLVAAPVKPITLFSLRFILFTCFNPTSFFQLSLFGFAPLIALGILASAPWYYYALLLPVTYLYLLIPAALGVTIIMLLMRFFSPNRLFQIAAGFNGILAFLWFIFIMGDQENILMRFIDLIEKFQPIMNFLFPLRSAADFWTAVIGYGENLGVSLIALIGSTVLVFGAAMLVISRVYYYNYERMQTAETRITQKTSSRKQKEATSNNQRSPAHLMVLTQWKVAIRNKEMAQGAFGIIALLAAYILILGRLITEGSPLIMLINIAVTSFFVNLGVQLFFLPFAMINDHSVLTKQYWLYKSAPLNEGIVSWAHYLASIIPALPIGLLVLILANYFTGITGPMMLLSLAIITFVLASSSALFQLTTFMEAGALGEEIPFLTRAFREIAPLLFIMLALIPIAAGFYFQKINFLFFLHPFPEAWVLAILVILSFLFMIWVFQESISRMKRVWVYLEIK